MSNKYRYRYTTLQPDDITAVIALSGADTIYCLGVVADGEAYPARAVERVQKIASRDAAVLEPGTAEVAGDRTRLPESRTIVVSLPGRAAV